MKWLLGNWQELGTKFDTFVGFNVAERYRLVILMQELLRKSGFRCGLLSYVGCYQPIKWPRIIPTF